MATASESIQAYAAKQKEFNDQQDQDIADLTTEFKALNDLIAQLQNSPGQISPEDQATLDQLQSKAAAFTQSLTDLRDANRPVVTPPQSSR